MKKKAKNQQGLHVYRGINKQLKPYWFWILNSENGRTLVRSSQMYTTKQACIKCIKSTFAWFNDNGHYYDHTAKEIDLVVLPKPHKKLK